MDNPGEIMRLCRLCLVKDQVNIPIFDEQGDIRQIFLKISSCLPVKVSREDPLPKSICDGCSNKLDLLYEFRNTSANAEKTLLSWVGQADAKDVDETVTAAAHQVAKPSETQVKQEEVEESNPAPVQDIESMDAQESATFDESSAKDEEEEEPPPPKRARRTAAVKAQINIAPDSDDEDDDDDDLDGAEPMTKIEDESEESDDDKDPSYQDVPGTSADDQPGPSGVGKDGVEAPSLLVLVREELLDTPLPSKKIYQCRQCLKFFDKMYWLQRHMLTHPTDSSFCCTKCKKTFTSKFYLRQHERRMHNSARETFQCDRCQKILKSQHQLSIHTLHHTNEHIAKCEFCGKKFFDKYQYRRHLESKHGDNQTICQICGKGMSNKYHLNAHMEIHGQREERERQKCSYCKKEFKFLKAHIRRVHTNKQTWVCKLCGKNFAGKSGLDTHLMLHKGIKPFRCHYCEKMFTVKSNLKLHIRTHTGERPYQCTECDKCFSHTSPLKIHMRIHSGEKFYSKMVLNTHKKSVHKVM